MDGWQCPQSAAGLAICWQRARCRWIILSAVSSSSSGQQIQYEHSLCAEQSRCPLCTRNSAASGGCHVASSCTTASCRRRGVRSQPEVLNWAPLGHRPAMWKWIGQATPAAEQRPSFVHRPSGGFASHQSGFPGIHSLGSGQTGRPPGEDGNTAVSLCTGTEDIRIWEFAFGMTRLHSLPVGLPLLQDAAAR